MIQIEDNIIRFGNAIGADFYPDAFSTIFTLKSGTLYDFYLEGRFISFHRPEERYVFRAKSGDIFIRDTSSILLASSKYSNSWDKYRTRENNEEEINLIRLYHEELEAAEAEISKRENARGIKIK